MFSWVYSVTSTGQGDANRSCRFTDRASVVMVVAVSCAGAGAGLSCADAGVGAGVGL